ncbi:F-box protein CPR1-like [Silene latifolia]|uniref:F-box protein CPR1-like n=1 Tax=Silene latifolia TaxID=37657 RepID=UPI003D77CF49
MKQTRSNRSLPEEIIMEILSWLHVKTLLRFKSASKSFFNLIISPKFVKLHLDRSLIRNPSIILPYSGKAFLAYFDVDHPQRPLIQLDIHPDVINLLEPFIDEILNEDHIPKIIGICNGVVCFKKEEEIVLYNPATRAYRQVPRKLSNAMYRDELIAYDCVSNDFKIFSIIQYFEKRDGSDCETYLYKLSDNSWSKIESPPRGFHYDIYCSHIANNSLYWITRNDDSKNIILMRFDVSSHRYEELPLPIQGLYPRVWDIRLGVLNGRLHMVIIEDSFDIWMLKEDNCWVRVFRCSNWIYFEKRKRSSQRKRFPCLLQYGSSKDESKIIVGVEQNRELLIICCHLESQTTSVVQVIGLSPEVDTFTAMAWAESLVPLA